MVSVKMTRDHNGYAKGETVELEPSVADAFVVWAGAAVYCAEPTKIAAPESASDKMMRPQGGKSKVRTK